MPEKDPKRNLPDADQVAAQTAALAAHLQRAGARWLPIPNAESVESFVQQLATVPHRRISEDKSQARSSPVPAPPTTPTTKRVASSQQQTDEPSPKASPPARVRPSTRLDSVALVTAAHGSYPGDSLPIVDRERELEKLSVEVSACTRCEELASCRNTTVFGEGSAAARVAFFGEGPGADEDRTGRPFVGRAGQLLTKMIEACKFRREDVYILNTVKCRPPGNRNPEPIEIENCRSFYEQQLAIVRPEYIVCLGAVSAQELLQSKLSVGRLRGKLHQYYDSKVLVTYHPAYLLRNPAAKKAAWEDLQLMLRDAGIEVNRRG